MQEKSPTLTPNKRLARDLNSVKTLPITAWLADLWLKTKDPRILLNPIQERLLWQKIIVDNLDNKFKSLDQLAIDFHELTNGWQLDHSTSSQTEEITIFQNIFTKFKKYCKNKELITSGELLTTLLPYLPDMKLEKVTFAGFDEYTPQLQTFIEALEKTGCKISHLDPNQHQNSEVNRLGCDNSKQEISLCAEWTKKIITKNPKTKIGIVVQNLGKLRPQIAKIFTEVLTNKININISAGIPLKSLPIVNNALDILSLSKPFDLKIISKILLSPYIIDANQEKSERALINLQLQKLQFSEFTLSDIESIITKCSQKTALITILKKWQEFFLQTHNKIYHNSEWSKIFADFLQIFGWPGQNNLTDQETIAIKVFSKILQDFAKTDLVLDKTTHKKALQMFHEFIIKTSQPDPKTDTNINIIGPLEAAGINFDYLWVMGLNQENWPQAPHPNPFIPIADQKKLSLPHSSAQRELHFCDTLLKRYKRSAKKIIFSYIKYSDDRPLKPSPLIIDIPEIFNKDLISADTIPWSKKIYHSKKTEQLIDNNAPQLKPNELNKASSNILELQSLCPFQAFMEFRLKTPKPIKTNLGISKIDRGTTVHKTLEIFWQKIKTQQDLNELDQNQLQKLIESSVTDALDKLTLSLKIYDIEKKCLIHLLTKWLETEKKREPFKVEVCEKPAQINLGPITIKLRIDRIDETQNGKKLLIDYKTGKNLPTVFDWFGERLKNPQLPLYSLAIDSITSLALGQINPNIIKFKEISLDNLIFGLRATNNTYQNKSNISWQEIKKYWLDTLTIIAEEFASGKSPPTPLSPKVCKQCSFSSICRRV